MLLVLERTKLYCIYTWRRELVICVVPPFKLSATFISTYSPAWSTAPALAAPIQNLELGKGIPARGAVTKEVHDLTNIGGLFFSVFFSEIGPYIARSSVWGSSLLPGVARVSSVLERIIIGGVPTSNPRCIYSWAELMGVLSRRRELVSLLCLRSSRSKFGIGLVISS